MSSYPFDSTESSIYCAVAIFDYIDRLSSIYNSTLLSCYFRYECAKVYIFENMNATLKLIDFIKSTEKHGKIITVIKVQGMY